MTSTAPNATTAAIPLAEVASAHDRVDLDAVRSALLDWGSELRRDLPWRRTRDPWWILVAEVMLQQTQVRRVEQRWGPFLERFPTPADCAVAPLSDVLIVWHGLGFPRRARYLHLAAQHIDERGGVPDTLAGLLGLPGVGQYTARAVLAFAFERDAAVVDTNVARILSRTADRPLTRAQTQAIADRWLPRGAAWEWNQTLLDLGATVCRPRPHCRLCPIASSCRWRGTSARPDPARMTAQVSKPQAAFAGSHREARGRLMAALVTGPVALSDVAEVMSRTPGEAKRLVLDLCADGLVVMRGDVVQLPGVELPGVTDRGPMADGA